LNLENRFVIGFVGSFKPWREADFLLAAFEDFHRLAPSSHFEQFGGSGTPQCPFTQRGITATRCSSF